jgi:hypothetical protein
MEETEQKQLRDGHEHLKNENAAFAIVIVN